MVLSEVGRNLLAHASQVLNEGEAAEAYAGAQSEAPRGTVRLAVPMSFGLAHVAPILPEFLSCYPEVMIHLHLGDEIVDLVGGGFDMALRIAALADSTLITRRLCQVRRLVVGAPAYFDRRGRPTHPSELANHECLGYAYLPSPEVWRFAHAGGDEAVVTPHGPLRANNAMRSRRPCGRGSVWRFNPNSRYGKISRQAGSSRYCPSGRCRPSRCIW